MGATWAEQYGRFMASMAREEKPTAGLPVAMASPLTVAIPTRTPVKEPGPSETAKASTPSGARRTAFRSSETESMRRPELQRSSPKMHSPSRVAPSESATEEQLLEVSMVSIFIDQALLANMRAMSL